MRFIGSLGPEPGPAPNEEHGTFRNPAQAPDDPGLEVLLALSCKERDLQGSGVQEGARAPQQQAREEDEGRPCEQSHPRPHIDLTWPFHSISMSWAASPSARAIPMRARYSVTRGPGTVAV